MLMALLYYGGSRDILYNKAFVPGLITELIEDEPDLMRDFIGKILVEIADLETKMDVDETAINLKANALYCAERLYEQLYGERFEPIWQW